MRQARQGGGTRSLRTRDAAWERAARVLVLAPQPMTHVDAVAEAAAAKEADLHGTKLGLEPGQLLTLLQANGGGGGQGFRVA